jgi:hypothetical protein
MNALARPVPAAGLTTADRWLAALLLLTGLIIRVFYVWHFRIDSDEPQHLHVVWAWANGMLPYRDVFDNHAPLFQALSAPLFHLLGVRPDILIPMRVAMLPIYVATIFCVWKIAAALFPPRIALWTAVLTAFCPVYHAPEMGSFFFTSIEYRPDELWALLWLATLTVLVTRPVTPRRALVAGLLLGLSFTVSMKTTLYILTLLFSFVGMVLARRAMGAAALDRRALLRCVGMALLGMVVMPALVVLFFVMKGAGPDMYYCVIKHNVLPQPRHLGPLLRQTAHWLLWLPIAVVGSWIIARLPQPAEIRTRIVFIYLAGVLFFLTLVWYWPILTAEDYLPFFPAMMITAGAAIVWLTGYLSRMARLPAFILPALCAAGELAFIVTEPHAGDPSAAASPLVDQTTDRIGFVADILKLTEPTDFVMDAKGETIYRQRASRQVMEALTIHRLLLGLNKDDIVDRLIETRTPVLSSRRMTARAHEFIRANYIVVAWRLKALGQLIRGRDQKLSVPCSFEITIPARYTLVTPSGTPTGELDGTPFTGPRELAVGHHEFKLSGEPESVALVWANAIDRGFSPFAKIRRDYTTPQD